MDPLSVGASLLAVTTAAIQSTKLLYEYVQSFKRRDRTLERLRDELLDLKTLLDSLKQVCEMGESILELLQGPVERCAQSCRDFEQSMKAFSAKSKASFLDWAKMEFMKGDINDFIDTVSDYKSTISVALGVITIRNSKVSQKALQDYNDMITKTIYNLELHLQRIDERMARLKVENIPSSSINLKDEREVTKQCLRICGDARAYILSLPAREPTLLQETPHSAPVVDPFEAQVRMRQVLDQTAQLFSETLTPLQNRLISLVQNNDPGDHRERERLQSDINMTKQCVDICEVAREATRQKIYRVGEAIAEKDSDQLVVNTLAEIFDVGRAVASNGSAQLLTSTTDESLQYVVQKRYESRFGVSASGSNIAEVDTTSGANLEIKQDNAFQNSSHERKPKKDKSFPNEVRKRTDGSGAI